jgi:transcriptional regulator with XRE-family HTH domain
MKSEQEELYKAAGAMLRECRLAAGLAQEDVSAAASVDQSNLSKAERFGPHGLSFKKLTLIAESLGCVVEIKIRKACK